MISYFGNAIDPALNVGVITDENSVANLESLQMFEADTATNLDAVAERSRNRPPNCPPHQMINFAVAIFEPCIIIEQ